MKKGKIFSALATVSMVIMLTGCGKAPQAEIDSANAAIEAARTAGADIYVSAAFAALTDSMKTTTEAIEAQKSKFFKNYGDVKESLAGVETLANEVKAMTEARIEEIKVEIQNGITEIEGLVAENKQLILEAPKGKEGTTALTAIKNEIGMIESSVSEIKAMFENGEFMPANDRVKASRDKAMAINTELKEVIAKYKSNVRAR